MPSKPRNRVGEIYGKLTVMGISGRRSKAGNVYWWCICECGNKREVSSDCLSNKKRKKKNITACKKCSKEILIKNILTTHDQKEHKRRIEAAKAREILKGQVPKEWLELPLTDQHARQLGKKHFFRGIRCLNHHLSPYRINGGCLKCQSN